MIHSVISFLAYHMCSTLFFMSKLLVFLVPAVHLNFSFFIENTFLRCGYLKHSVFAFTSKDHEFYYSGVSCSVFLTLTLKINMHHTPTLYFPPTYVNCVPFKDAELEEELKFDLPFLEQLLHLALGLIQLLQHALNVGHGAVVRSLVARDGRVSVSRG